jgi:hypothetical protein
MTFSFDIFHFTVWNQTLSCTLSSTVRVLQNFVTLRMTSRRSKHVALLETQT